MYRQLLLCPAPLNPTGTFSLAKKEPFLILRSRGGNTEIAVVTGWEPSCLLSSESTGTCQVMRLKHSQVFTPPLLSPRGGSSFPSVERLNEGGWKEFNTVGMWLFVPYTVFIIQDRAVDLKTLFVCAGIWVCNVWLSLPSKVSASVFCPCFLFNHRSSKSVNPWRGPKRD